MRRVTSSLAICRNQRVRAAYPMVDLGPAPLGAWFRLPISHKFVVAGVEPLLSWRARILLLMGPPALLHPSVSSLLSSQLSFCTSGLSLVCLASSA